jgi:hypothetical protein
MPLVGNRTRFSVSIWVNLRKCASSCTAISVDGTQTDQFNLGYRKSCAAGGKTGPCWIFSRPDADAADATVHSASSTPGTAKLGKWTQLTGVYDSVHGMLTLYVNGHQAGQADGATAWSFAGNGRVRIGNLIPGGSRHDWTGRLSNACVFYGALQLADVRLLHVGNASHPHNGCAALFDKTPSAAPAARKLDCVLRGASHLRRRA